MCLYKYSESCTLSHSSECWQTWNIGPAADTRVINMDKRSHLVFAFLLVAILVLDGTLGEYHRSNKKKYEKKNYKPQKNEKHSRKTRDLQNEMDHSEQEVLNGEAELNSRSKEDVEKTKQHYRNADYSKAYVEKKEVNKRKGEDKKVKDGSKYKKELNEEIAPSKNKVIKKQDKHSKVELQKEEETSKEKSTMKKPSKATQKKKYVIIEEVPIEDEAKQNKGIKSKITAENQRTVRYLVEEEVELVEEEQEQEQIEEYETTKCFRECDEQSTLRRKVRETVKKCTPSCDELQADASFATSREVSKRQSSSIIQQEAPEDNTLDAEEEEEDIAENEKCYY